MKARAALLFALAAVTLPAVALPANPVRIRIEEPLVSPKTPENVETANGLLDSLAGVANRLFAGKIEIARPDAGASFEYSLAMIASLDRDSPSIVTRLKRISDNAESPAYPWISQPTPELPSLLAHAVAWLLDSFTGYPSGSRPPAVVDELPAGLLSPYAYPWALAMAPDGSLLAALGNGCVSLDHSFRVLAEPGKNLAEAGTFNFALGVSVTPAGTILLKPGQGSSLFRIEPDATGPRKMQTGIELATAPVAALPDGSVLVVDSAARKAVKILGKKRADFPLFAGQSDYISVLGVSPDSTVWVYDYVLRAFRIYNTEARLVDYVLPLVDPAKPLAPVAVTIGPDGTFIVLSSGALYEFSRDGSLQWKLDSFTGLEVEKPPMAGSVAADWGRGIVYVADTTGRRIVKLLDVDYCKRKSIRNDLEEKLIALREAGSSDEPGPLAEAARLYQAAGSPLMERAAWQKALDAEPANPTATARIRDLEIADLKRSAADFDKRARETLLTLGPESARAAYAQALQTYEQILSRNRGDKDARTAMEDLKKLFEGAGPAPERPAPLIVRDVKIPSLFPALMQYYLTHPVGTITVANQSSAPVEKVRVRAFIPRYMDFPSESRMLARLEPGAQATFDLVVTLKPSVLELQEDMAAQIRLDAVCTTAGAEQSVSQVSTVTINRNTALTWDDTRKIAAYITPNEETVSGFARRMLDPGEQVRQLQLSRKIFIAMHICDALGAYGMTYVPNPETPISKVLGNSQVVDTVHFPRDTLANRGGDCSDTTALLASLLESVGIRTAVLTTPGHIFLAFDSGEPVENAGMFSANGLEVIVKDAVWIPVETTVLRQGFFAAWQSASELVHTYRSNGPFEFLPLAGMRDSWPALPLPPGSITVVDPSPLAVEKLYSASLRGFTDALYTARVAELSARLAGLSGKQANVARIRLGILHAMFGRNAEAEAAFKTTQASDPTLVSPYVNLANLHLLAGDADGALAIVMKGLAVNRSSGLLNLLAARIYLAKKDGPNTAAYFAKLKSASPDLAARYADSLGQGVGAGGSGDAGERAAEQPAAGQRAAGQGAPPTVIWGSAD